MPVYEYVCRACGHRVEELQKAGAGPPGPCPECLGELRRVYGPVGVVSSGWGFRKTDSLLPEGRPRKDFRRLKQKAEDIADR
jgi:putative FmdB family regulatory protein